MQGKNLEHRQGQQRPAGLGPGHTRALTSACLSDQGYSSELSPPGPHTPPHRPIARSANVSLNIPCTSSPCREVYHSEPIRQLLSTKQDVCRIGVQVCVRAPASGSTLTKPPLAPVKHSGRLLGTSCLGAPSISSGDQPCAKELGTPGLATQQPVTVPETQGTAQWCRKPSVGHPPTRQGEGLGFKQTNLSLTNKSVIPLSFETKGSWPLSCHFF